MIQTIYIRDQRYSGQQLADAVGFIPEFLSEANPQPARVQLNDNYAHGGGWRPMEGWALREDDRLVYPGDPPMMPIAELRLRDERILVYPHAWVCILYPDQTFEVARMD
jgi:hypothetical protein